MSLIWTRNVKPLGVEAWVAGATPGLRLEQEAIEGLSIVIDTKGADPPTINEILGAFKRIVVNVAGTDYINISGYALYYLNVLMAGGSAPWTQTEAPADTRQLVLFLPFAMEGGMHSPDTLLDLRRTAGGLVQATVRFELDDPAALTLANCSIAVYQHFYTLGNHTRKIGAVRQLRERTVSGTADEKATIVLDHGSDFDDLTRLVLFGISSAGALISWPCSPITLTISENGTREIFHFVSGDSNYVIPRAFNQRTEAANGAHDKGLFVYDFLRGDLTGRGRTLRGALDASNFSNLTLEFTPGSSGTYHLLLDRLNAAAPSVEKAG